MVQQLSNFPVVYVWRHNIHGHLGSALNLDEMQSLINRSVLCKPNFSKMRTVLNEENNFSYGLGLFTISKEMA